MADSHDYSKLLGLSEDRIKEKISIFTHYIVVRSVGIVTDSNIQEFDKFMSNEFTSDELKFFASGFLINKTEEVLNNMIKSGDPIEVAIAEQVIKVRKEMLSRRTQN